MSNAKLSDDEKREVSGLAYRGRRGIARSGDLERCQALYEKDPTGYSEAGKVGRAQADEETKL